jgi:thiol:disulfide interchange protein DsbA
MPKPFAIRIHLLIAAAIVLGAVWIGTASAATAPAAAAPVEGVDYSLIAHPDPVQGPRVQVVEVFSYRCIHCAHFQPDLAKWEKTLSADVQFSYLPAAFGGDWDVFARAFFAAQVLHVQQQSHDLIFKAIFDEHRIASSADLPSLYADFGVDPKVFASTMQTAEVDKDVEAAHQQIIRWDVESTPTIVVDGMYKAQLTVAGGPAAMLRTVDWLIARQRPLHPKH